MVDALVRRGNVCHLISPWLEKKNRARGLGSGHRQFGEEWHQERAWGVLGSQSFVVFQLRFENGVYSHLELALSRS